MEYIYDYDVVITVPYLSTCPSGEGVMQTHTIRGVLKVDQLIPKGVDCFNIAGTPQIVEATRRGKVE